MHAPDDGRPGCARADGGGAPDPIQHYEAIAQTSRKMLCAARREDWDEVARLEDQCRRLIAELKAAGGCERLGGAQQRRRIELLRGILADDAQIRARAEPWLHPIERAFAGRGLRR